MDTKIILKYLSELNINNRDWYHAHIADYKDTAAKFEE